MLPEDDCVIETCRSVLNILMYILGFLNNPSSGATALQGLGRQSGRRRSAKLVPTFCG